MNVLPYEKVAAVVASLRCGNGVRETARRTGVNKLTVSRLRRRFLAGEFGDVAPESASIGEAIKAVNERVQSADALAVECLDALLHALSNLRRALSDRRALVAQQMARGKPIARRKVRVAHRLGAASALTEEQRARVAERKRIHEAEVVAWRERERELERSGELERVLDHDQRLVSFDRIGARGEMFDLLERLLTTDAYDLTPEALMIAVEEARSRDVPARWTPDGEAPSGERPFGARDGFVYAPESP